MKRLLIISPHFPPVHAPDAQRVIAALPYLRAHEWEPTVLAVEPDQVAATKDSSSLRRLPSDIRIERCGAWTLSLTSRAGLRNLGWRAHGAMRRAGNRLIREIKPDLIFFSTTQNLLMTLGPRWRRQFGIPYVLDIQDPWITDYYERPGAPPPPGGWKYRLARSMACRLEASTFAVASGFVSVSPTYLESLSNRYAWFGGKPQAVIPFGVDPKPFDQQDSSPQPAFAPDPEWIQIVSVGAVGSIMSQALRALFAQVKSLLSDAPELGRKLRFRFYGTSYAPPGQAEPSVMPLAQEYGLADLVTEETNRLSADAAFATMKAADALVILTSDDPGYTPSKLAGCFLANVPVLLVTRRDGGAERLNRELGLAQILDPDGATPSALSDFLQDLKAPNPQWISRRQTEVFHTHHTAQARTQQLSEFLHRILAQPPPR